MADSVRIDNPILHSPFAAPARHFAFGDGGITDRIVEGRRRSEPHAAISSVVVGPPSGNLSP